MSIIKDALTDAGVIIDESKFTREMEEIYQIN